MKSTRPRPDLLLVLARTDRHGIAELVGTVCYRPVATSSLSPRSFCPSSSVRT